MMTKSSNPVTLSIIGHHQTLSKLINAFVNIILVLLSFVFNWGKGFICVLSFFQILTVLYSMLHLMSLFLQNHKGANFLIQFIG
jgi:hypothetical protein